MSEENPTISIEELVRLYEAGHRNFQSHDFMDCTFENIVLDGADFHGSWFHSSEFNHCSLKAVNFTECNVKCCDFVECDLSGTTFENSSIDAADFTHCDLTDTNFTDCGWYGHNLTTEEFWGEMKGKNLIKGVK